MTIAKKENDVSSQEEYYRSRKERISIDQSICIGCGSCVISCPNGGFKVVNGKAQLVNDSFCDGLGYCLQNCPMHAIKYNGVPIDDITQEFAKGSPRVSNWPIKLHLIKPTHSMFKNADLAIVADCVPAISKNYDELVKNKIVLTMCSKIENTKVIREKLINIINKNNIKSIVSYSVDYICCEGHGRLVKDAIRFSNKKDQLMDKFKNNVICLYGIGK
ncbi:MAG: ATP-binding protein [Promethearchaeota archaeon]